MKKKVALIFGVTGQDGAYLSKFLLKKKYKVFGVKRRSSIINTQRVDDIYIMDQNTFPIPKGRWGYLPVEIQNFLKERSITYQLANLPTQIKPNTLSILRHGIEESINQSFLACITDIMFYTTNQIHTSITDFKHRTSETRFF